MVNLVNHINKMQHYALYLSGNSEDAKDLLQELAVKVFSNVNFFTDKTETEIIKWMTVVLKRLNVDMYRKFKPMLEISYSNKHVENDAWHMIQKRELQKALSKLAINQKVCFRLRLEGYPTKEIKDMLRLKTINVNQHLMKAKYHLKKQLAA